ncbi:MAG TPA: immunoglobulin domain-containing protein, partial [Candidatus Hydrogenedentes bacterium]|nr:immunoglobulin domain-containing protein [Candidatus Hydrogenedentota bacterium]
SGFDWRKNGAPLSDGGRVSGVTTRTLRVMALQVADSGTYTCAYEDGAKAQQTFVAQVQVGQAVPVANGALLISLTVLLGLSTAVAAKLLSRSTTR